MSERDDLTEQAFHDPLLHTTAIKTSALATADRAADGQLKVDQPVLSTHPNISHPQQQNHRARGMLPENAR